MWTFLLLFLLTALLTGASRMIDVNNEQIVIFSQLARRLPRRRLDRAVSVSTVYRWRHPGVFGVRLEALRSGGAWVTSLEAYQRFCEALTKQADPKATIRQSRSNYDERIDKQLDNLGFSPQER